MHRAIPSHRYHPATGRGPLGDLGCMTWGLGNHDFRVGGPGLPDNSGPSCRSIWPTRPRPAAGLMTKVVWFFIVFPLILAKANVVQYEYSKEVVVRCSQRKVL